MNCSFFLSKLKKYIAVMMLPTPLIMFIFSVAIVYFVSLVLVSLSLLRSPIGTYRTMVHTTLKQQIYLNLKGGNAHEIPKPYQVNHCVFWYLIGLKVYLN